MLSPFAMSQPDFSPAADRNKQPILDVLRQVLAEHGCALEIAPGTAHAIQESRAPSNVKSPRPQVG